MATILEKLSLGKVVKGGQGKKEMSLSLDKTIESFKVYESFDDAESAWVEIQGQANCHVFQTFEWQTIWMETMGRAEGVVPAIVVFQAGNGSKMLLPLGVRRSKGVRVLEWLGGFFADYQGPVIKHSFPDFTHAEEFLNLWRATCRALPKYDVCRLKRQPAMFDDKRNPFVQFLHPTRAYGKARHLDIHEASCDLSDFLVKPKRLSDSRRQIRRLNEIAEVEFCSPVEPKERSALAQTILSQKSAWHKSNNTRHPLDREPVQEFFNRLSLLSSGTFEVRIDELRLANNTLAAHLGFQFQNRFYYFMPSYELGSWQKYSPGRLLLEHLVENCLKEGVDTFDFTIGEEQYKESWRVGRDDLFEYCAPTTLRGVGYILLLQAKRGIKSVVGNLRKYSWHG